MSLLLLYGDCIMQSTNSLCLIKEFHREIAICRMKTPIGFTLRRQFCDGPAADLPANIRFDGIDHTKVSFTQE